MGLLILRRPRHPVDHYDVYRGVTKVGSSTTTGYTDTALEPSTSYSYTVKAVDAALNASPASNTATATTLADTSPPTAPTNLAASPVSATSIGLSWTASTDDVAVDRYDVYRGVMKVGSSTTTGYTDTGLQPSTSYSYTVVAVDAAGNPSSPSGHNTPTTGITPLPTTNVTVTPNTTGTPTPVVCSTGSLFIDGSSAWSNETGWSSSGGGISSYESKPAYQSGVTSGYGAVPSLVELGGFALAAATAGGEKSQARASASQKMGNVQVQAVPL